MLASRACAARSEGGLEAGPDPLRGEMVDTAELKEWMRLISESDFVEFEIEHEGFKLKLVKAEARSAPPAPPPVAAVPAEVVPPSSAPAEKLVDIHSPIVGTFYRSPSPDAPPFVDVGDRVKKGQVICIVEAMKLMNDIESEAAGEVVEILIANGQPVEYGEVLFRIRPSA